jgi:hypothetical protein
LGLGGASSSTAAGVIFALTDRYQTGAKAAHCFPVGYHAVKSAREYIHRGRGMDEIIAGRSGNA